MDRIQRTALVFSAALCMVVPRALAAQTVVTSGDGDVLMDQRLERLLQGGEYAAVSTDTTIARGDVVEGSLLVLGSTATIEGTIDGDLVLIDGEVFLRPSAAVRGDVINLGGGLYASELATIQGETQDRPRAPYRVRREGELIVIVAESERATFELDGMFGFHVPRYNRVDGLALDWGATTRVARFGLTEAFVHGQAGYRTDRGAFAWGGSLILERGAWQLEGGAERYTASNDRWIRGDVRNSLDFVWEGDDLRNYYEATTGFLELQRRFGQEESPRQVRVGVRLQTEDADPLETGSPWTLWGDDSLRVNPPLADGSIRSAIPWIEAEWLTPRTALEGRLDVELGQPDGTIDETFARLHVGGEWAMLALRNHTLEIETQWLVPLGMAELLPPQRWAMLGGSGTLRTLGDGAMLGDHLAYIETEYIIPFPRAWRLPVLGLPELQLLHIAGGAWSGERDSRFVQNLGARIEVFAFYARYIIDPENDDTEFTVGVSWPFDSEYPWQRDGAL